MLSIHDEDQKDHPANVFLAQPPCRSASESPQKDRRAVISLWKLIRHLCKREKLERRHPQLS